MMLHLVRLKLRLMANSFRRGPMQVVGLALGILYGVGVAVLGVALLVALRLADAELARVVTVIGGSVVTAGFLLVPLAFGVDDTLDPRRFALYGIPAGRLSLGLAITALVGVPAAALALIALGTLATWSRDPGSFLLALLSVPLIVATCVLAARVSTSVAAFLLATRRARELTAGLGVLVLVLLSPAIIVLAGVDWAEDGGGTGRRIADTLAWTPLGAAWAIPGDAATGRGGTAFLHLLLAAAAIALLLLAWRALVAWMLVTPQREGRIKEYTGLGWFDRLPGSPSGAVAARSATYWLRDPRYRVSLLMIPVTPFLMIVPLAFVGVPIEVLALIPVPVVSLLLGWSLHNDIAYDNTAIWLHVASGTSGRADRLGRLFPAIVVGIPVLVIGSVISAALHGDWSVLGGLLGVGTSLLLAGLGFSSVTSARFPYPVVRPGDSPFSQPQSTGATMAVVQSVSFLASLLLSAPAIAFAGLGLFGPDSWFWWSLAAGVGVGLLALVGGILLGARIFDRRGPELVGAAVRA
ncbi:MAG: hypothetical protein JWP66_277 [Naasia sp.]|nr:hypothetical protein [Naasia sp.]